SPTQAEETPGRQSDEPALKVVQRRVERRLRSLLARRLRQPSADLLERKGVVAEQPAVLLHECERGRSGLTVPLDRRSLPVPDDTVVADLEVQDVSRVLLLPRDHEGLR